MKVYDVYLAGYPDISWRESFLSLIDESITVYDPIIDEYKRLNHEEKADLVASELEFIEKSEIIVFYLCKKWQSYFSMLQLGDAVGRGKQVVICIADTIDSEEKIRRYCEYRGIIVVESLDDLVSTVEEYLAEVELCAVNL
jgi:hypothetical protein